MGTLNELVEDMVAAAENYPGIDLIWYRTAVTAISTWSSTILGWAVVVLSISIPMVLAFELLFINFPPLTAVLIKTESDAEEANVEKKKRNWGMLLNDARLAIKMQIETGDSVNLCYLKVKWKMLLAVTFVLGTLMAGGDMIVNWVTRLIGGVLLRL